MKLKRGPLPLYYQLERALRNRILSGKIAPAEPLPTERELCEEFGVSRITVRQALAILESEGLIKREQGRGTFATKRDPKSIPFELHGYVDDLFLLGPATRLRLISKELIAADSRVALDLELPEGEPVYLFEGERSLEGDRKGFFQAYVPKEIGERIDLQDVEGPLFIVTVEKAAMESVKRARQITSVALATERLASFMDLQVGHPLLVTKRIYYSRNDTVLETAVTYFPGDGFESVANLERIFDSD
jgi:GntR family transcriptional regulator